jgi:hypothetical protein
MTREQVIVYHKNPYSLPGFEPRTSGPSRYTLGRAVGFFYPLGDI